MHRYAPFYCEENVWWLAQESRFVDHAAEVLVISNDAGSVAMGAQRAGEGEWVVWDYHVVLAARGERGVEIWDLDTALGAPVPATEWLSASFEPRLPARFQPRFRVMAAAHYVASLASDRRQMRLPDGAWRRPPPEWAAIGGGAHTLDRLIDVRDTTMGEVIDLRALALRWT